MAKEKIYLCGDFENNKTVIGEELNSNLEMKKKYKTDVYLSCFVDIFTQEVVDISFNITHAMKYLLRLVTKNNVELYYHNLKYDGKFIIDWLLRNGWEFNSNFGLNIPKSFDTLITPNGQFYQITLRTNASKSANKIVIRDSLKIIPLKVEQIAKAYELPIQKGNVDYEKYDNMTPKEIEKIITKDYIDYCIDDVKIVAYAMKEQFETGFTKMTSSANAMYEFKERIGKKKFKYMFPVLDMQHSETESVDDFIRTSYKGGYTYVSPKFQNKNINMIGNTYDVNSLYPSVMYNEILPYGMPLYFKGKYNNTEGFPLYIQRLKCHFKLKKGFIPTIQIKGGIFCETEYLINSRTESSVDRITLTVTNIDLETIFKHYEVTNIDYIDGYMFEGKTGIFKEYIDHWGEVKKNSTGGMRQLAKLMLNSLYGKFCSSTERELREPYLDLKDNVVKYDVYTSKPRSSIYTAMGSFITAYARRVTQEAFQDNINNCCYCDTDSIHIIGDTNNLKVHENELGYWKHECTWISAKFIRAKTYYEEIIKDDHTLQLDIKCAGMPTQCKEKVTKKNFKSGLTVDGKLVPVNVEGGVILEKTFFTIK